jgi:adenine C2-methylase RlmN of 23S rRNA A2503 and tRNA A37
LLAFLEAGFGLGPGEEARAEEDVKKRRSTAAKHCRAIMSAAVKDAESGRGTLNLSEARLPNIPKWAREGIPLQFSLMTTVVSDCRTSRDGSTTKMVVELQDGHRVESVVMRHDASSKGGKAKGGRVTLCVSSQVGCKMGCTFCATGTLGELNPKP